MHIQIKAALIVMLSTWMWTNLSVAQNQFQMPDIHPANDAAQNTEQPAVESPQPQGNALPPITPSSLYQNELRGNDNANKLPPKNNFRAFDSQPVAPKPRISSPGNNPASRGNFSSSQRAQPSQNAMRQDPLRQLNPEKLRDGVMPFTAAQPKSQAKMRGSSIPIADNAPKKSVLVPRISSSISDSSATKPATFNDAATGLVGGKNTARKLLVSYDVSSSTRPLPGVPVSLKDLMQTTPVRMRHAMVQQYWETYFDWATLSNRLEYSGWLSKIPAPRRPVEQELMNTARSMAKNDVMAAEIQLAKSQSKLQQLSQFKTEDLLPLPLNQPLVSKYKSHYDWYQARNMIPAKLKGINEMLPRTYELLDLRANTVRQAENARNQFKNSFTSGQIGFSELLESARVWQNAKQSFVSTVVSYNQAISDYALTITPAQKPLDQIVSMLVAKPKSVDQVAAANNAVRRQTQPVTRQAATQPTTTPSRFAQRNTGNPGRALGTQPIARTNNLQRSATNVRNNADLSPQFQSPTQTSPGGFQSQPRANRGNSTNFPAGGQSGSKFNSNRDSGAAQTGSGGFQPQNKSAKPKPSAPKNNVRGGAGGGFQGNGGGGFQGGGNFGG